MLPNPRVAIEVDADRCEGAGFVEAAGVDLPCDKRFLGINTVNAFRFEAN